jgi:ubiquitin C-terminal hydrolase
MITETENIINMNKCPRFNTCNIPKCPLDFFISERIELNEDDKCPLTGNRSNRTKGIKSAKLKSMSKIIAKINEERAKIGTPKQG